MSSFIVQTVRPRVHVLSSAVAILMIILLWNVELPHFVFQMVLGPIGALVDPCALHFVWISGMVLFGSYFFMIAEIVQIFAIRKKWKNLMKIVLVLIGSHVLSASLVTMKWIPSCEGFDCCPWLSFLP